MACIRPAVNYIFTVSENALGPVKQALKQLTRSNTGLKIIILALGMYVVLLEKRIDKFEEQLENMNSKNDKEEGK